MRRTLAFATALFLLAALAVTGFLAARGAGRCDRCGGPMVRVTHGIGAKTCLVCGRTLPMPDPNGPQRRPPPGQGPRFRFVSVPRLFGTR